MDEHLPCASFEDYARDLEIVTVADGSGALREFRVVAAVTAAPTCGPNRGESAAYVALISSEDDLLFEDEESIIYLKKVIYQDGERYFQNIEDAREYNEVVGLVETRLQAMQQLYHNELAAKGQLREENSPDTNE